MSVRQDAVLLRRELKPNFEDNYKMTVAIKQTVTMPNGMTMGDVTITITSDMKYKGGPALKEGKLPVTLTVSNYTVDSSVPNVNDDSPKTLVVEGLMDNRGAISEGKATSEDPKVKAMSKQILDSLQSMGFPEKPVKVGDTWEMTTVPSPLFSKKPLKFHLRFDGEKVVDSTAYWVVTAKEKVPVDVAMDDMPGAEAQPGTEGMTIKGTMDVTTEMLFEKSGRLFSSLGNVATDMEVESPQTNGSVHVVGDVIQKMNLVP